MVATFRHLQFSPNVFDSLSESNTAGT